MQRPLRPGCRARARGFTLLELMAALALSAIVVLLAVPSFAGAVARHRLQAAAEQLAHDLADARFEAAQRGTALHLSFATGAQWCYALALQAGCDCRAAAPCQISRVQAGDHPGCGCCTPRMRASIRCRGAAPAATRCCRRPMRRRCGWRSARSGGRGSAHRAATCAATRPAEARPAPRRAA